MEEKFMEKRAFERMPLKTQVKFFSGKTEYTGTMMNFSEKGMYISAEVNFPLKTQLQILIPVKEEIMKVFAEVRNFTKSGHVYNGIGIELINPPQSYIEFINSLRFEL
jgi:hypothetical protein